MSYPEKHDFFPLANFVVDIINSMHGNNKRKEDCTNKSERNGKRTESHYKLVECVMGWKTR